MTFPHRGQDLPDEPQRSNAVDLQERGFHLVRGARDVPLDRLGARGGVVDQHIDRSGKALEKPFVARPIALIELKRLDVPTARGQFGRHPEPALPAGAVGEPDAVPAACEPLHHRPADPVRPSGDEHAAWDCRRAVHRLSRVLRAASRSLVGAGHTTIGIPRARPGPSTGGGTCLVQHRSLDMVSRIRHADPAPSREAMQPSIYVRRTHCPGYHQSTFQG